MSDSIKTCAMCRKEVDAGAVLCPYCNSSTDYHYFVAVPEDGLTRINNKSKFVIQVVIEAVAVGCGFGLGFFLGGFWIGAGGSILAYKICTSITEGSPSDVYQHIFHCPACFKEEITVWDANKFDTSKSGFMVCSGCNKKTMIARS